MSAAEVLAAAVREHLGFHDCPPDENNCCATALLDALTAAGHAVIELPEPNQYDEWPADERGKASGPWFVWLSTRDIQVRTSGHADPQRARALAAALIAAAVEAERRQGK